MGGGNEHIRNVLLHISSHPERAQRPDAHQDVDFIEQALFPECLQPVLQGFDVVYELSLDELCAGVNLLL